MTKFRLFYDKDKGCKWINEMARKGYAMTGFCLGFFQFEKCEPGKYIYQVDFGEKFFSVSENYRQFMRENNIEIVQCWGPWVYLRKEATEGEFKLYTDVDSSIEHYTKILHMFKFVAIIELIGFLIEAFSAFQGNPFAIAFMFIIAALIFVMLRVVVKTKQTIMELKERKGEFTKDWRFGKRNVSMFIPIGMLFNSCALILQGSVDHWIKIPVQILAILFMLIGIYQTAKKKD